MKSQKLNTINYKKYSFKPYTREYLKQFNSEKKLLQKILNKEIIIEHFGSTSVPGLGGKGITDIIIQVPKKDFLKSKKILEKKGYEFKPSFKTRFFFKKYSKTKKIHIHLVSPQTVKFTREAKVREFATEIAVRDYLRNHKKEAKRYEEVKKKAAKHAQGIGQKYRDYKKSYLDKLEKKALMDYV